MTEASGKPKHNYTRRAGTLIKIDILHLHGLDGNTACGLEVDSVNCYSEGYSRDLAATEEQCCRNCVGRKPEVPEDRKVTLNTGGPKDIYVGAELIWMHSHHGGGRWQRPESELTPVNCRVEKIVDEKKIVVRIKTAGRKGLNRPVPLHSLRWPKK